MQSLDFESIIGFSPNPMQEAMWDRITSGDCAVLLKSPTGSGKTEAVVAPSMAIERRLFMIFPARSLVEDQIGRLESLLTRQSKEGKRLSLVVDTGGRSERRVFQNGTRFTDGQSSARRHLYDGDVIVTTLDKFLYRFFGFGEEQKSYIFPFRIFSGLKRNLFVFDEAHAYEDTAFTNFVRLIKALYTANLDLVVMTATMPPDYAKELDFLAKPLDFVDERRAEFDGWHRQWKTPPDFTKTLRYLPLRGKATIAGAMIEQAKKRQADNKRLIVTLETVEDAAEVWQKLGKPLLYHGRLDGKQRESVYSELKKRESNQQGYVLVTTSAIEVGCDLNADCLITEICNPASLIQRAGRCNRRGDRSNSEIVVVGNTIKSFLSELNDDQEAAFVSALKAKRDQSFQAADFLRFIQRGVAFDYRAEILFDMLFEYVYEGRLENKPLHERGLVVTRSWEPSVMLTTNKETMSHAVSVPISRCAARKDEEWDKQCRVYVRYFNRHGNEYDIALKELEWGGWTYFRDLVIEVQDPFDPEMGFLAIPRPFRRRYPEGYKETLAYSTSEEKTKNLYYLNWKPEPVDTKESVASSGAENETGLQDDH